MLVKAALNIIFLFSALASAQKAQMPEHFGRITVQPDSEELKDSVDQLCNLCREYIRTDPDSAIYFGRTAHKLALQSDYKFGIANSDYQTGRVFYNINEYDSALTYFQEAKKIWQKTGSLNELGNVLGALGNTHQQIGNYYLAHNYYMQSLTIRKKINDKAGLANIYANLGIIHRLQGNYEDALDYQWNALALYDTLGNTEGKAYAFHGLGNIFLDFEKYEQAYESFENALALYTELDNKRGISLALGDIALYYESLGNLTKAEEIYRHIMSIHEETNNELGLAYVFNSLGRIYRELKRYRAAENLFENALNRYRELDSEYGISIAYNNLGQIAMLQGKPSEAVTYFKLSNRYAEMEKIYDILLENYEGMSEAYSSIGQYKAALEEFTNYSALKDSIKLGSTARELAELELMYEQEKQSRQIELLQKEKELQSMEYTEERRMILTISLVLFLTILLLIFIYSRFRQKKSNREYLQTVIDSLNYPFFVINTDDYTIEMLNEAAGKLQKSDGVTCHMLSHNNPVPCDNKEHRCPLNEIRKTGQPSTVEHFHLDIKGNRRAVEVHGYPIFDKEGNLKQMIEYSFDITERRGTEEILNRFRAALDNSADSIFIIDRMKMKFVDINKTATLELGYSKDEFLKMSPSDIKPEYNDEQLKEIFDEVIDGSVGVGVIQTIHTTKDGSRLPVEIYLRGFKTGKQKFIIASSRDITERLESEKALKESEEKYRKLINASPDAVTLSDTRGIITYASPKVLKIYGIENLDKVIGHNIMEFIHPDYIEKAEKNVAIILNGKKPGDENTYKLLRSDGKTFWGEITSDYILDAEGKPVGMISITRDVTDRIKAQDELRNAKLEAERANQAKSEFLANMSHELRTPLNGILGYAQILRNDRTLSEQQRNSIEIMKRSGEHLLNLINDILDISKIEAHRMEMTNEVFNLKDLIDSIIKITEIKAAEKGLHFISDNLLQLPANVKGDERKLRQVLLNLLSNAVKFTDEGKVEFRFDASSENGCTELTFNIIDTGIGIDKNDQEKIFHPFQQISKNNSKTEGTGLGLAITRQLTKLMEGSLTVTSSPGNGSCFTVKLSLQLSDHPVRKRVKETREVTGYSGDRKRVLIVDDQLANRELLESVLEPLGFETCSAVSGDNALMIAPEFRPHLILMDLVMPGTDGLEATRQIRSRDDLDNPVIIALTARAYKQDKIESIKAGCNDFLTKPVDLNKLLAQFNKHLDIEWQYRDSELSDEIDDKLNLDEDYPVPGTDMMKKIRGFAAMGDIASIRKYVNDVIGKDGQYNPFCSIINGMIKNFAIEEIINLVDSLIDKKSEY